MKRIYLDNNATTRPHDEVIEAVTEAMADFGNPSSMHWFGQMASARVDEAHEQVASTIGASPGEVHFCGGGHRGQQQSHPGSRLCASRKRPTHSVLRHRTSLRACRPG